MSSVAHRLKWFRPRSNPLAERVPVRQSFDQTLGWQVSRNPAVPGVSATRSERMYRQVLQVGEHNRESVPGRLRPVGAANQTADRELMAPPAAAVVGSPPLEQEPLRVELHEVLALELGSALHRALVALPRTLARPDVHCDGEDRACPVPHFRHQGFPPNHVGNQVPGEKVGS